MSRRTIARAAALALVFGAAAYHDATHAALAANSTARHLTGPMRSYAWFPGRWACRTAAAAASAQEPTPAKLWVTVDAEHDGLREEFASTSAGGKPYRSDNTLSYDTSLHAYVRRSVDINGTQIVLAAKAPYKPAMNFEGFAGARDGKLYRMRAAIGVDAAQTEMAMATSFWHADTKSWVVQGTAVCSKIPN
jgi:hypothetical protein